MFMAGKKRKLGDSSTEHCKLKYFVGSLKNNYFVNTSSAVTQKH